MRHWLNIGHCEFTLVLQGTPESIVGKMISHDDTGCTILKESDGQEYGYTWAVIQNVQLAE